MQIHADETKSSLQFASRALRVTNCARVNEVCLWIELCFFDKLWKDFTKPYIMPILNLVYKFFSLTVNFFIYLEP